VFQKGEKTMILGVKETRFDNLWQFADFVGYDEFKKWAYKRYGLSDKEWKKFQNGDDIVGYSDTSTIQDWYQDQEGNYLVEFIDVNFGEIVVKEFNIRNNSQCDCKETAMNEVGDFRIHLTRVYELPFDDAQKIQKGYNDELEAEGRGTRFSVEEAAERWALDTMDYEVDKLSIEDLVSAKIRRCRLNG